MSTRALAEFAATLKPGQIPEAVMARAEDLFLDWLGSALAGRGAAPVETIANVAMMMGPPVDQGHAVAQGASAAQSLAPAEVLIHRRSTSAYWAAMVNAASSHVAEQDDVHNGSVFHPATVVFPVALALAQSLGKSGRDLLTASVAGYEVGIRVGEFLGRSHYKVFHTTGTAGTLAASATAGHLLGLEPSRMHHALGSAGTQAAGLWEFLRTAADSKQLHTAHAASAGLMSALLASQGFTGAEQILEGPQGMAAGMSGDANPARLTAGLHERWATAETSFKYHASCRHTHPAADALLSVMREHGLRPEQLARVVTHVHQGAIDVLGPVLRPATVHQSKFSMGTVLALVAQHGHAGLAEFDRDFLSPQTQALRDIVVMELDEEVDRAYPNRWIGKVTVTTTDGRTLHGRVDEPKGDPGNTLSRTELEDKAVRLATYSGAATEHEVRQIAKLVWRLRELDRVGMLLSHE